MNPQPDRVAANRNARIAGLLYLLVILAAPVRLIVVPDVLFVSGNTAATVANIASHEAMFRFGIICDLFTGVTSLLLALALYRLFKGVDKHLAVLMIALGIWDTPLYFFNAANDAAALIVAHSPDFLSAFDLAQHDALAMFFLHLHGQNIVFAEIFWGLWLLPLALLVYRSGFLPRLLGVWLFLNGLAYLTDSVTGLLLPAYQDVVGNITMPIELGEVAFMLWLLIMGAKGGFRRTPIPQSRLAE